MDQNTTVTNENTSFSTILLIAGAIVALGAVAGITWWFWKQNHKIRDLEDEAAKLRDQIQNPQFTDAEQQALYGVAQGVIAAQGSFADLGRAMADTLSRMRKNDGKAPQTQQAAPAQVPTQQAAPAPVPAPTPAPAPQAPAPQQQPTPEEQAPASEANKEVAAANQSWTAQS